MINGTRVQITCNRTGVGGKYGYILRKIRPGIYRIHMDEHDLADRMLSGDRFKIVNTKAGY